MVKRRVRKPVKRLIWVTVALAVLFFIYTFTVTSRAPPAAVPRTPRTPSTNARIARVEEGRLAPPQTHLPKPSRTAAVAAAAPSGVATSSTAEVAPAPRLTETPIATSTSTVPTTSTSTTTSTTTGAPSAAAPASLASVGNASTIQPALSNTSIITNAAVLPEVNATGSESTVLPVQNSSSPPSSTPDSSHNGTNSLEDTQTGDNATLPIQNISLHDSVSANNTSNHSTPLTGDVTANADSAKDSHTPKAHTLQDESFPSNSSSSSSSTNGDNSTNSDGGNRTLIADVPTTKNNVTMSSVPSATPHPPPLTPTPTAYATIDAATCSAIADKLHELSLRDFISTGNHSNDESDNNTLLGTNRSIALHFVGDSWARRLFMLTLLQLQRCGRQGLLRVAPRMNNTDDAAVFSLARDAGVEADSLPLKAVADSLEMVFCRVSLSSNVSLSSPLPECLTTSLSFTRAPHLSQLAAALASDGPGGLLSTLDVSGHDEGEGSGNSTHTPHTPHHHHHHHHYHRHQYRAVFASAGMWDAARPTLRHCNFSFAGDQDLFAIHNGSAEALRRSVLEPQALPFYEANVTRPLLAAVQAAASLPMSLPSSRALRRSSEHSADSSSPTHGVAPTRLLLSLPTLPNCSAPRFTRGGSADVANATPTATLAGAAPVSPLDAADGGGVDVYRHIFSKERCEFFVHTAMQLVADVLRRTAATAAAAAVGGASDGGGDSPRGGVSVSTVDWGRLVAPPLRITPGGQPSVSPSGHSSSAAAADGACLALDGVHLSFYPFCEEGFTKSVARPLSDFDDTPCGACYRHVTRLFWDSL